MESRACEEHLQSACESYQEETIKFLEKLNDLLIKLGGGSILFSLVIASGKPELEPELRSVLTLEEKKELHREDLISRRPFYYKDQRGPFENVLEKYWCNYIADGKIGKLINELEFYLNPLVDDAEFISKIVRRQWTAKELATNPQALADFFTTLIERLEEIANLSSEQKAESIRNLIKVLNTCKEKIKSASLHATNLLRFI